MSWAYPIGITKISAIYTIQSEWNVPRWPSFAVGHVPFRAVMLMPIFVFIFVFSLSHLAVSNSTPPPSTSPIAIKVKSEPVSPPRDHHMAHPQSSASLSITTMNNATSNSNVLNHPQQHLIMSSRPNSTGGHLTPTPGTVCQQQCECGPHFFAICFLFAILLHFSKQALWHRQTSHHRVICIGTITALTYKITIRRISHTRGHEYRKDGPHPINYDQLWQNACRL